MTTLGFELVDRHVVGGRGDDVACFDDTGPLTYAQLLEKAAALGGGLWVLGVRVGSNVVIDLPPGNARVAVLCALTRLGAVPSAHGDVRIVVVDGVPQVNVNDSDVELSLVERAGRSEPAASLRDDPPGYADEVRAAFPDIVDQLLSGLPVV